MATQQWIVSHGKYAGSSFEHVVHADVEYAAWLMHPTHRLLFSLRMFALYCQVRAS